MKSISAAIIVLAGAILIAAGGLMDAGGDRDWWVQMPGWVLGGIGILAWVKAFFDEDVPK